MLQNKIGVPVDGQNFFDREAEQRQLWARLRTDHVMLLAPRRVGKTSLMFRLRDTAPEQGFRAFYLSVSGATTERDFQTRLCDAVASIGADGVKLSKKALRRTSGVLGRLRKASAFGASVEVDKPDGEEVWQEHGHELMVGLGKLSDPILILVDELPLFVLQLLRADPSTARARRFLEWLRTFRQELTLAPNVRWLFAGSLGLDTITARHRLSDTINDLGVLTLGPFTSGVADAFLTELGRSHGLRFATGALDRARTKVEWLVPYHLHLLFSTLLEGCFGRDEVTTADIDDAHERLLGATRRSYFDWWRQRLGQELGPPDDSQALALLAAAAKDPTGARIDTLALVLSRHVQDPLARDEQLRYLLGVLENDGYLVSHQGRLRFRSALLREFWVRWVAG